MNTRNACNADFSLIVKDYGGNTSVIKHTHIWKVLVNRHTLITFSTRTKVIRSYTLNANTCLSTFNTVLYSLTTWSTLWDIEDAELIKIIDKIMIFSTEITDVGRTACNTVTQNSSASYTFLNFLCKFKRNIFIITVVTESFVGTGTKNAIRDCSRTVYFANIKGLVLIPP